jgi:hypothetical protein
VDWQEDNSFEKDCRSLPDDLVDIGFDVSTSCTGIVLLNSNTGDLIDMLSIKLNTTKLVDVWDKASYVKKFITENIANKGYKINKIFIEEAHMKFTSGFSSAATIFSLARFNGIVSFMAHELLGPKPTMVNVRTARKLLGINIDHKDKSLSTKEKVLRHVTTMKPDFPWIYHVAKTGKKKGQTVLAKENEDRCDAYVICAGGQKLIKEDSVGKKSKKKNKTV